MLRHALNTAISMDSGAPAAHELLLANLSFHLQTDARSAYCRNNVTLQANSSKAYGKRNCFLATQ